MPELTRPHDRARDAFGRLLVDPAELSQRDRIDVLRRLAGSLQADATREARWLGCALSEWIARGGDLAGLLGVRPQRGSHRTAQRIVRQEAADRALLRLAAAVGCDRAALRIVRGEAACPPMLRGIVDELRALGGPTGDGSVSRARGRVSGHRR